MRRIWARKVAVSLWSDANGHWPWSLEDLPVELRNALLGWNPEEEVDPDCVIPSSTASSIPKQLAVGLDGDNGQWIRKKSSDAYAALDTTGHPVWSADPLFEWELAFFHVKPLLQDIARRDAVFATSQWLCDEAFVHDDGEPFDATSASYPGEISLKKIVELNYGGCHYIAALIAAVLRPMGIPCLLTKARTVSRTKLTWTDDEMGEGDSCNHASLICRLPEGSLAVFHADFLCAYMGQRYGSPELMWIPYMEWLLVQLLLKSGLPQSAEDDIYNMLTAHWHDMAIVQMAGMASQACHDLDENGEHPYWLVRVHYTVSLKALNDGVESWLDAWREWAKNGGSLQALSEKFLSLGDDIVGSYVNKAFLSGDQYDTSQIPSKSSYLLPLEWAYTDLSGLTVSVSGDGYVQGAVAAIGSWLNDLDNRIKEKYGSCPKWRQWLIDNGWNWHGCPPEVDWLAKNAE